MKRRPREAGRLLIASVDDSQMALGKRQGVEPTGGYGTTMRSVQIDLDVLVEAPQGITFYKGPPRDGVIRLRCAYRERCLPCRAANIPFPMVDNR
jgi:hypothetical protein